MNTPGEILSSILRASGLSQRELARRAHTSNAALIAYQKGRHDPLLSTLVRIADAGECDLVVEVRPRLTTPEERTLEMHRAIATKLKTNPENVRAIARRNLLVLRDSDHGGHSAAYLDTWERLLDGPVDALVHVMVSTDQAARNLRQASPFSGVLTNDKRIDSLLRTDGVGVVEKTGKSPDQLRRDIAEALSAVARGPR
jgi:transcriptional regulator with XRE-family HTH domain